MPTPTRTIRPSIIEGLPGDLPAFVALLADIVLNSSFPEDELERERRVIEQEFSEFDEDPASVAFQLFDRACYGLTHPAGRPIIGTRANIRRFARSDLLDYAKRQYTASNVVVAAADRWIRGLGARHRAGFRCHARRHTQ